MPWGRFTGREGQLHHRSVPPGVPPVIPPNSSAGNTVGRRAPDYASEASEVSSSSYPSALAFHISRKTSMPTTAMPMIPT